ncbi:MAG: hypothetical protein ABI988_04810 [Nitrospirota bacterium]
MTLSRAIVSIDHHHALIQQFHGEDVQRKAVSEHTHNTRQHASGVRSEHEFFGEVCDSLVGIAEVLVAGSHTAQADFRHYVEKHRPTLVANIAGWETVDHLTNGQLVAFARKFFVKHDNIAGTRPLV